MPKKNGQWVQVGGNDMTAAWNVKGLKEGSEIEGVYIELQENVGPNKSNIYILKTKAGNIGVWGSTVIDSRMAEIPLQSEVKLVFRGMRQGKRGEYKDYSVFVKGGVGDDDADVIEEAVK